MGKTERRTGAGEGEGCTGEGIQVESAREEKGEES